MHSTQARDKIFKSWSGISEITIIKEVATKGEHIDLCVEYWAHKRKQTTAEYQLYFQDVVHAYVQRLLSERLVCKAETVLRNVDRDVKCFFYQYACECEDAELGEFVLDHLRGKNPENFAQEQLVLQYYWELVKQLRECSSVQMKHIALLPRVHVEALMTLPGHMLQRILVELYFANNNESLLPQLSKQFVWQYFVDTQNLKELRRWCLFNDLQEAPAAVNKLQETFVNWFIEGDMYEYALDKLKDPCEPLRNYFARAGYIFANELDDMPAVLRRLCTMQCLEKHNELLKRQPLAKHLMERGHYQLLLLHCVPASALEQLMTTYGSLNEALLGLIGDLKTHDLTKREGFEALTQSVKTYLERTHCAGEPLEEEHPLLTFYDFLCHEPNVAALEGFLSSSDLNRVPYLKSLLSRFDHGSNAPPPTLPTPHDLFLKFRHINLAINSGELASFSNPQMCQRYARKIKLNSTHYLKQHRSAYAVYYLCMEQLQLYGQITRTQLFHACETATELALLHASNNDLVTHCVAFCEMLGFDTQLLRSFLLLQRLLPSSQAENIGFNDLINSWDDVLVQQLKENPNQFPLEGYQALMRVAQGASPVTLLGHYSSQSAWWQLLLLLQYFDLPLAVLQQQLKHFKNQTLGINLLLALSCEVSSERQHKRTHNRQQRTANSSQETMTNSSNSSSQDANLQMSSGGTRNGNGLMPLHGAAQPDLFALLLSSSGGNSPDESITSLASFMLLMQGHDNQSTAIHLLRHCIRHRLPVHAVLAATVSSQNANWCWLVWLAIATNQWNELVQVTASKDYVWHIVRGAVASGQLQALLHSFIIFQSSSQFTHLCRFLHTTAIRGQFDSAAIEQLRLFFCAWSLDTVYLPLSESLGRELVMQRCLGLLLIQLEHNFDSLVQQRKFLECICRSDVGDICNLLDFCLLHRAFDIAGRWMRRLNIKLELLVQRDSCEYKRLVNGMCEARAYNEALQLAALLQLPLGEIVYAKWMAEHEAGLRQPSVAEYEREVEQHTLPPEILVNFLLHAAGQEEDALSVRRYELLFSALSVIKRHHLFPNETFDRDQIEYDMIYCQLQIPQDEDLSIYHSEYFEQIMLPERCVLYKSFAELKELAGIDDLSIGTKHPLTTAMEERLEALIFVLLDKGDIVQALRLQELFEQRPNDLRFIVFAMALAEGVTSIFNLSTKERQLLSDIEKSTFPKFNRLALSQGAPARGSSDWSDSCSTLCEFEEIPSKEKQQTLDALLGIGSKLKHGVELGKRIVLIYRAAMYLDKAYLDVLRTKDVSILLKSAAEEQCLQRLLVVSDIQISMRLTPQEIAAMLALELAICIIRPRFYIFHASQQPRKAPKNADLWGYNIDHDFHLYLELAPNSTILGNYLLEYCDALKAYRKYQDGKPYEDNETFQRLLEIIATYGRPLPTPTADGGAPPQVLSHKKQNQIYVELLIKAHHCYVHECSMEGMVSVLHRAKHLNNQLTKAKSWTLIVRMLIGIARYREMFYCFDSLVENEQFESLLGQFDEDQKCGLRQAIIYYLREYNPKNSKDLLRLAALHFLMYKELAEIWESEAKAVLEQIRNSAELPAVLPSTDSSKLQLAKLKCSTELVATLQQALENYTHATENYLLDNKLLLVQQSVAKAELIAMQIDLCTKALEKQQNNVTSPLCVSVISVKSREEFRELANTELRVPQTLILNRAYGYDINWSQALLSQFVIGQKGNYLKEFQCFQRISDEIISQVVKSYMLHTQSNNVNIKQEESLFQLVELTRSVTLKYKLASVLGFKSLVMSLINDSTVHYLRDTDFGRNDSRHAADM